MRQRAIRSMIGLIFSVLIMELCFAVQGFAVQGFAATTNQPQADKIIILKSAHTMTLLSGDKVLKTYKVALGTVPVGPKQVEGDHKTPEGNYTIDAKNPQSIFHLSLHISYPDAADRQSAARLGARPGGAIMIHGLAKQFAYLGPLHRQVDWNGWMRRRD